MSNVVPIHTPQPESSVLAEQALLGALLTANRIWSEVCALVSAEDFSVPSHQAIFRAIGSAIEDGASCSPITLAEAFDETDLPSPDYLHRLVCGNFFEGDAVQYARTIHRSAAARNARSYASAWAQEAANLSNLEHIADEMMAVAESIRDTGGRRRRAVSGEEAVQGVLDTLKANIEATRAGTPILTVKTGLRDIDSLLGGLYPGDLIILAGRPSMGKSALALSIADNVARDGWPVLIHSLEMSVEQNVHRMLSTRTGISSLVFRSTTPNLSQAQLSQIVAARDEINAMPLYIDDTASLTIGEMSLRAKAHKARHGLALLIVDYLQLMSGAEENIVQRISAISRGLKVLARELDVPVIALSQLSRAVEQRENKRPQLSDLRESGAIEQDADIVAFVYREAAYERKKEPHGNSHDWAEWKANYDAIADHAEVIIDKHRQGPTGTAHLTFDDKTTQFRDRS